MIRTLQLFFVVSIGDVISLTAHASHPRVSHALTSPAGAVCAGPNNSKGLGAGTFEIKIGNNAPVYFDKWQWLAKKLDIKSTHIVLVLKDKRPAASWKLRFTKSNFMIIWRDATTWHMKAISGVCGLP
jgi:hypothetical protein